MSHGVGVGTVAVVALLTAIAGCLVGYLLAYRDKYGQHSTYRNKYRTGDIQARAERPEREQRGPDPLRERRSLPVSERARVALADSIERTEDLPRWPVTDADDKSRARLAPGTSALRPGKTDVPRW